MVKRLVLAIAVAVFVGGAPAYAGVDPGNLCKEAKGKAAGKKASDLLKAFGKNTKKSDASRLSFDISKARSKFTKGFNKADTRGPCPFPGDAANVEPAVDGCVSDVIDMINFGTVTTTTVTIPTTTTTLPVTCDFPATGQTTAYQADKNDGIPGPVDVPDDGTVQAGAPLAYVDNGDGTITDVNTGLMWEKKSDDGTLHDKDNQYVWSGDGSQETIWDWLDDVNAESGTGFADHRDWRIPNAKELQSIIDYGRYYPSVNPVFNTGCTGGCTVETCSCTVASPYWSSTTDAYSPGTAWRVFFNSGYMLSNAKANTFDVVRAVRGGL